MAYNAEAELLGTDVSFEFDAPWAAYWVLFLRLVTGWWMFHAGLTKLMENGLFGFEAGGYLEFAAQGTILYPVTHWFAQNAIWLPNFMIPVGEFLIGLGLLAGVLTRLAAFFGAFLMVFFYTINAGWAHGMVSGDLWGLLAFVTVIVFGAGRIWGGDAYLEQTRLVKNNPWLRYLLG